MRVELATRTDDEMEPQRIELAFEPVPSPATVDEIRGVLDRLVRAAIG